MVGIGRERVGRKDQLGGVANGDGTANGSHDEGGRRVLLDTGRSKERERRGCRNNGGVLA